MIPSVIICGIMGNAISGFVVEAYGSKYEMTVPYLCLVKDFGDFLSLFLIYTQTESFTVSLIGNILQLMIGKGWHAPAILILKSVLSEDLLGYAISIFYVILSTTEAIAPSIFAHTMKTTIGG